MRHLAATGLRSPGQCPGNCEHEPHHETRFGHGRSRQAGHPDLGLAEGPMGAHFDDAPDVLLDADAGLNSYRPETPKPELIVPSFLGCGIAPGAGAEVRLPD